MKRIVSCLLAASFLTFFLSIAGTPPSHFQADAVFADDSGSCGETDQESLYTELFDIDSAVDISVDIAKDQLTALQQDYDYYRLEKNRSSVYRIADSVTFTVNGQKYVIDEVGIRLKGATSRMRFFHDIFGIYNLVHFRLCFNCTFDDPDDYGLRTRVWSSEEEKEKRTARTFATLQSIELKWNIYFDSTYTRTVYAHELFREYGVPAQRCRLSTLSLGGCRLGVYRMFEPVDEGFIHRYFPPEDWGGDLYKVRCTVHSPADYRLKNTYGISSNKRNEYYNFDLKTNHDTSHHGYIRRLLETVNKPDVTRQEMDALIDAEELARMMAADFAIGNLDDLRNNYNNHYVYFCKSDGKAVFIPYDNEFIMDSQYEHSPSKADMTLLSPYYGYNYTYSAEQRSPLVRQVVLKDGYYTDLYTACLRDVAEGDWLTEEKFLRYFNAAKANYGDKILPEYCFMSTLGKDMRFSMESNLNGNGEMTVTRFLQRMRENILNNTTH